MKNKPIVRQLEEKYGGKWVYIPFHFWTCDELNMTAHYVAEGYDIDGNPIESKLSLKPLRIYGNGKRGEWFFPYK